MGRKSELDVLTNAAGLYYATWSPGDGATRYRFFHRPTDYHAGDAIYTALGRKEALTFLWGFRAGQCADDERLFTTSEDDHAKPFSLRDFIADNRDTDLADAIRQLRSLRVGDAIDIVGHAASATTINRVK